MLSTLTLQTVSGGVVANLIDNTNYALRQDSWAPKVAKIDMEKVGSLGMYEDVEEVIAVNVIGTSLSVLLTNLQKLQNLVNQARLWFEVNDDTLEEGVLLRAAMTGSSVGTVDAVIIDAWLELPTSFNDLLMVNDIPTVTLHLVRRGAWLGTEDSANSLSVGCGALWTCSVGAHGTYSPVRLNWKLPTTANSGTAAYVIPRLGVIASDDPNAIQILDIGGGSPTSPWANITPTNALGASAWQLTPAVINTFYGTNVGTPTSFSSPGRYIIVASMWAQKSWSLYASVNMTVGSYAQPITLPVVAFNPDADTYGPGANMVVLGSIDIEDTGVPRSIVIYASCPELSTTLQLDFLAIVKDQPGTNIISFLPIAYDGSNFGNSTVLTLAVDHKLNALPTPRVTVSNNAGTKIVSVGYAGDVTPFMNGDTYKGVFWGGWGHAPNTGAYRLTSQPPSAANTLWTGVVTALRRRAYLTLQ